MYARWPRFTLAGLLGSAALWAAINPTGDILASWPAGFEEKHIELLRQGGVTVVLLPWPGAQGVGKFARACRAAGIVPVAQLGAAKSLLEIRKSVEQARAAGFNGVAVETGGVFNDEKSLRTFLAGLKGLDALVFLKAEQAHWRVAPAQAVLRFGQWPGVRFTSSVRSRDIEVSSASRDPWLDANSYLVAYLRGMFPTRAAWLGYGPDQEAGISKDRVVPEDSLELALIETFVVGGSVILSFPEKYQAALLAGEERALATWRSLARTAAFLKQHAESFRQPSASTVAVAAGSIEQSGEILNMLYRRNVCPVVFPANAIPDLEPTRFRAVVVANVAAPPALGVKRVLEYAAAGGTVLAAPAAAGERAWWLDPAARKTRTDEDRDWYSLGTGRIIAYRAPIEDPSEFALDVIDAVGVRTRDLRLWNAGSVIGLMNRLSDDTIALGLINYGWPRRDDFPVRVEGVFRKATFIEPGAAAPRPLKTVRRGTGTEVRVDRLKRFSIVVLE